MPAQMGQSALGPSGQAQPDPLHRSSPLGPIVIALGYRRVRLQPLGCQLGEGGGRLVATLATSAVSYPPSHESWWCSLLVASPFLSGRQTGASESISAWHAPLSLLSDSESAVGTRVQALTGALTPLLLVWMTCQAWAGTFTPSKG